MSQSAVTSFVHPLSGVTLCVDLLLSSARLSSPQQPPSSPSAFSVTSSSSTTPDRTRFPRNSSSRSTFHGAQLRDRRPATYNGPPASPSLSQHTAASLASPRRGTSTSLIGKITSKFVRRSVKRRQTELHLNVAPREGHHRTS